MGRALIVLSLSIAFGLSQCFAKDVLSDKNRTKGSGARTELVQKLFQNYDRDVIPDTRTHLKFGSALVTTKLNVEDSVLDSLIWLRMVWDDPRLKWNETDFGGIGVVRVHPSRVWIPDIHLYNSAYTKSGALLSACDHTSVLIYPHGEVLWVPPCRFSSLCMSTVKDFPYDPQKCLLKFGSWTYDGFSLSLSMYNDKNYMDMSDFWDITEWKVVSAPGVVNKKYFTCCEEPYIDVSYNVTVQRKTKPIRKNTISNLRF